MAAREREFTAPTVQLLTPSGELRPTPEAEEYLPLILKLQRELLEFRDPALSIDPAAIPVDANRTNTA